LKDIPLELVQHIIELDTSIPPTHQKMYKLNPKQWFMLCIISIIFYWGKKKYIYICKPYGSSLLGQQIKSVMKDNKMVIIILRV
jgi:hypothetical protein